MRRSFVVAALLWMIHAGVSTAHPAHDVAGAVSVAVEAAAPHAAAAGAGPVVTGTGAFRFEVVAGWGGWPEGVTTATHGGVAVAADGRVFVGTESAGTGILVFSPEGELLSRWGGDTANAHGLTLVERPDGTQVLLAAHTKAQKLVTYALDGTVRATIDGAGNPELDLNGVTAVTGLPDGTVFAATGYGKSELFRFAPDGALVKKAGGKGDAEDEYSRTHGLTLDPRFGEPRLLVADREKGRLVHLSLDLEFLGVHATGLRRPCVAALRGDTVAVAELQGRVTLLGRDGQVLTHLGDNPDKSQWANFKVAPDAVGPGVFTAPHGVAFDADGGLIVQDWNKHGRVTRLAPVVAE